MSCYQNYPVYIINTQYIEDAAQKAECEKWNQYAINKQSQQQTSSYNYDSYDNGATSSGQYIYHSYFGSGNYISSVIG